MPKFEVGDLFADRYEIKELLGRGGMGVVYRVQDWRAQKEMALKTLLPRFAKNKQAVLRFEREVNAAGKLNHPCIVKIYDSNEVEGILYYTMDYFDGKSLRKWMAERKKRGKNLGVGSTVRVLSLLCSALEHAHEHTIHRDLSPENVMVLPNGEVKLLDFGLAKITSVDQDLTRVGVSLGKVQYCSPEQRADAKNVDLRADIYSLGVMFFEMLSGELPIVARPLRELVPDLPPEAEVLVNKAMAEDPDDRYSTAREFRRALMDFYRVTQGEKPATRRAPRKADPVPPLAPAREPAAERIPVRARKPATARMRLGRVWDRVLRAMRIRRG